MGVLDRSCVVSVLPNDQKKVLHEIYSLVGLMIFRDVLVWRREKGGGGGGGGGCNCKIVLFLEHFFIF